MVTELAAFVQPEHPLAAMKSRVEAVADVRAKIRLLHYALSTEDSCRHPVVETAGNPLDDRAG